MSPNIRLTDGGRGYYLNFLVTVNYESSYPALLDNKLGEDSAVMNLGLNGYEDDVAATRHAARSGIFHFWLDLLNVLRRHSYLASSPWGLRWWLYFRPDRLARDDPKAEFESAATIHSGELPASSDPGIGQPSKSGLHPILYRERNRNFSRYS